MTQVTLRQVDGGGNTSPSPPTGKKGFKLDKKMLYIIGGVVVVIALLFTRKQATTEETYQELPVDYPLATKGVSNGVDVQAQLDQFGSIISNSVDATLTQAIKEMQNSTTSALTEQNSQINNVLSDWTSKYNDQMGNLHGQMNEIGQMNNGLYNQIQQNMAEQLASLAQQQSSLNVNLTPSISGTVVQKPPINMGSVGGIISGSGSSAISKPPSGTLSKPSSNSSSSSSSNSTSSSSNSSSSGSKGVSQSAIQNLKDKVNNAKNK